MKEFESNKVTQDSFVATLSDNLESKSSEYLNVIQQFNEKSEFWNEEKTKMEIERKKYKLEISHLTNVIENLQSDYQSRQRQVMEQESNFNKINNHVEKLNYEIEKNREHNENYKKELEVQNGIIDQLKLALSTTENDLQQKCDQIHQININFEQIQNFKKIEVDKSKKRMYFYSLYILAIFL